MSNKALKIGIITFHWAPNAGAVLQAYALKQYLFEKGFIADVINYTPKYRNWKIRDLVAKNWYNLYIKYSELYFYYRYKTKYSKIINIKSKAFSDSKSLIQQTNNYDIIIAGSDQIWNTQLPWFSSLYFLDFPFSGRKISYAASMGQGKLTKAQEYSVNKLIQNFDSISVREHKAKSILEKYYTKNHIEVVPDPTFLLPSESYKNIMTSTYAHSDDYICSYILDTPSPSHLSTLQEYHRIKNIKWYNIKNPESGAYLRRHGMTDIVVTPEKWLSYIKHAKYVISGSFHCTVFSLIFHKPFVYLEPETMHNSGGNQRIISLLKPLGLLDRVVFHRDASTLKRILETPINWDKVDNYLNQQRAIGEHFLINSLQTT